MFNVQLLAEKMGAIIIAEGFRPRINSASRLVAFVFLHTNPIYFFHPHCVTRLKH